MDVLSEKAHNLKLSPSPTDANEGGAPISKKGLKKAAKEAEKNRKKAEASARLATEKGTMNNEAADFSEGKYGNLPLIQSTIRTGMAGCLSSLLTLSQERRGVVLSISTPVSTEVESYCEPESIIYVCKVLTVSIFLSAK
jgi:hypothetical protein